jgi:hypothetical protein
MYVRADQADIRVTVGGVPYGDSWKSAAGGVLEVATDVKVRPGAMGKEVSVGGLSTRSDLTVETNMTDVVAGWVDNLEAVNGSARVSVTLAWLNADGTPMGPKLIRRGTLKNVTVPDMGANSDAAMFGLVIACDELAG